MNNHGRQIISNIAKRKEVIPKLFVRTLYGSSKRYFSSFSMLDDYNALRRRKEEESERLKEFPRYKTQVVFFSTTHDDDKISMRDRAKNSYQERAAVAKLKYEQGKEAAKLKYVEGKEKGKELAKRGAESSYEMLLRYGPVFVGFYASLYCVTFGSLYIGIDSGLLDPATLMGYLSSESEGMEESRTTAQLVVDYLNHYSWTKPAVPILEKNPHFANLAVTWVTTKLTEPIRLVVTVAVVPRLAAYLGFVPKKKIADDTKKDQTTSV